MSKHRSRVDVDAGWIEWDMFDMEARIGDRLLPERLDVVFPGAGGQPALHMVLAVVDGIPQCRELHLTAADGARDVRTGDLRAISLEDWVQRLYALAAMPITHEDSDGGITAVVRHDEDEVRNAGRLIQHARAAARRTITPKFLQEVADVYLLHLDDRPLQAIRQTFGVAQRTAANYAKRAEQAGLLPTTTPGKKRGQA